MIKKIILFFIFTFSFIFNLNSIFAIDNNWIVNITLEFKLEDENKKTIDLPLQAVWKNSLGSKTYSIQNFWKNWFISMSARIPKNEIKWTLTITNSKGEKKINEIIKIPLDYNIQWISSWSKRILYYLQFKQNWSYYEFKKYYSQFDEEKEVKEELPNEILIKWKFDSYYFLKGVEIWLYNNEGTKIYKDFVDDQGRFEIKLNNYETKIELWKDYYLIWWKDWTPDWKEYWFLYEWMKYNFSSYRKLFDEFKDNELSLKINLNKKDEPVKEDFPFLFTFILSIIYLLFIYKLQDKIIRKSFVHPLKRSHKLVKANRKDKIINIKETLWI